VLKSNPMNWMFASFVSGRFCKGDRGDGCEEELKFVGVSMRRCVRGGDKAKTRATLLIDGVPPTEVGVGAFPKSVGGGTFG
jgi:hypothetical protein